MDQEVMFRLTYGLFILTAGNGERDNGCIVNTVSQVTAQPTRVMAVVDKKNHTHRLIVDTGEFNVSVLSEDSKFATYRHWGFQSGRDADKLQGVRFARSANGLVYITEETNAWLSAKVVSSLDLGSHTLFIADVTDGAVLAETDSVTYQYYQRNIKPSVPAPGEKKGFICTVCGYIYEGDILPEDFICPWCGHPAVDFKSL